jgi:hypothetical protein
LVTDPLTISMSWYSVDITAYAGQTVRIDFEFQVQDGCLPVAFDSIRIE